MDKELDDLLDSALDDFNKNEQVQNETEAKSSIVIEKTNLYVDDIDYEDRPSIQKLSSATSPQKDKQESVLDDMKLFEEIFNDEKTKESFKQFKDVFDMFNKSDPNEEKIFENLEKVMSQLNTVDDEDEEDMHELEFLKKLVNATQKSDSDSTEIKPDKPKQELYEDDIDVDDDYKQKTPINKVLNNMNKETRKVFQNSEKIGGDDDESSLIMEPILSMLFSKDILYPSLKLMLENYDKYLEEKKEKLNAEEIKKLHEQKSCITEMCLIYEQSKEDDSKEVKSEHLKKILDLLEKCGMPPSELVPEVNPFEALGDKSSNSCPIS